ncbi:tetratricopeptide repeat protein, partial [Elusimicrobiota bacterium]
FKKGIEYTNQGKYEQAIKQFTQVITGDSDYANAYLALGIVYINKEMENEAVALLKKAAELDPANKKTYFILARLYEKLEDDNLAIAAWEKYLSLSPEKKFEDIANRHIERLKVKMEDTSNENSLK